MIGVLIGAGLIFYAVLYSGVRSLRNDPITTLDALMGRDPRRSGTSPGTTSQTTTPRTGQRPRFGRT